MRDPDDFTLFGNHPSANAQDLLWASGNLGMSSFTPLSSNPSFEKQAGVSAFFTAPFASTQTFDIDFAGAPSSTPVTFISDAELQLFERDPDELYQTLTAYTLDANNDAVPTTTNWLQAISTPRAFPTGEITSTLNPLPLNLPAVIDLDLHASGLEASLDAIPAAAFWMTSASSNASLAVNAGGPALTPGGWGSVKGLRYLQHGPCELEVPIQPLLTSAKVTLLEQALSYCGTTQLGVIKVNDFIIDQLDVVTYLAHARSGTAASAIGSSEATAPDFGILVHGIFRVDAPYGVAGPQYCPTETVWDYRFTLVNGIVDVVPHSIYYTHHGTPNCLPSDYVFVSFPNGVFTHTIPNMIRSQIHDQQYNDFAAGTPLAGLDAVKCHPDGDVDSAPTCEQAANLVFPFVEGGAQRVLGLSTNGELSSEAPPYDAKLSQAFHSGAANPDGTGSWYCDAQNKDPNQRCRMVARMDRIIGQVDGVTVRPFDSIPGWDDTTKVITGDATQLDKPGLGLFFALVQFNRISSLCGHTPIAPRANATFSNRWYASINAAATSCADHTSALPFGRCSASCTHDSDCNGGTCTQGICLGTCKSDADCGDGSQCLDVSGVNAKACVCRGDAVCDHDKGRCNGARMCSIDAECEAWQTCDPKSSTCVQIKSGCSGDDPFATCPAGSACSGGECVRL